MKCLNLLVKMFPLYVRFESLYFVLAVCDINGILSSLIVIGRIGIPRRCNDNLAVYWNI